MIKAASGVTTVYHYDLDGKLIAESEPDGDITTEYLFMGKIRMAVMDVSSGTTYYYLNDRLGTPLMMTDDTDTVVWEAYYKPFGEAFINPNSTVVNNIRLPGQYYDEETGLHYNYHRYYDPRTGRYLTPDPSYLIPTGMMNNGCSLRFLIYKPAELNLYQYATNNPINYFDPKGLQPSPIKRFTPIWECPPAPPSYEFVQPHFHFLPNTRCFRVINPKTFKPDIICISDATFGYTCEVNCEYLKTEGCEGEDHMFLRGICYIGREI